MTEPDSNVSRIQRLWDTFENEGPDAAYELIDEIFDPDVEFNPLRTADVGGGTYRGHDGVRGFFGEMTEALRHVRFEPPQYHAVGDDMVIVFTRLIGSERQDPMPIAQDLALVYEFSEGRVRCVTAYDSPAEALEAAERGHADA